MLPAVQKSQKNMRTYPIWEVVHDGNYDSLVDTLLANRGLTRDDLSVDFDALHPPQQLLDLERGVERLESAIRRREKILVFGDYDADGVTSTAVMLDFLHQVGAACAYLLPDRHRDGYGIKPPGVRRALERGADVIVTVDNGIAAVEALALAREEGVDVVVVDHHRQLADLPPAHSIINPNRRDCTYPFKGLAGVGVTFKVVQALSQAFMDGAERRRYLNLLLDLVALGTVADVMPVLEENRVLIQRGLAVMEKSQRPGIKHLRAAAGYEDKPLNTTAVGFYLAPRINVAGRLESADLALKLLSTGQEREAVELAGQLNRLNQKRQQLQREGVAEAEELVAPEDVEEDRILVLLGERWHLGVVGLLASKLAEKYACPTVVCTEVRGDGVYTGSARSIPGYDISAGINACAQHLTSHGGHEGAAGFSMEADSFEAFRTTLIGHAREHIAPEDLQARLSVDLFLQARDISLQTVRQLADLEPFGAGHEVPVFAAKDCKVVSCKTVGKDRTHLKLGLDIEGRPCNAMWWGRGALAEKIQAGLQVSVAFALEEDTFTGHGAVQLVLKDMFASNGPTP